MPSKTLNLFIILLCTILCFACEAAVGDKCDTTNDCPIGMVCDRESPGGYCLSYNCELNEDCMQGAVCVAFTEQISYCLKKCKKNSDCRKNYVCRDDFADKRFCYVESDATYGRDPDNELEFQAPDQEQEKEATP
ncbi:MAG: hypothetical protein ACOX8U_10145 [Bradymonadia bacterium]|jgi:hypothetical protein